jgi:hypothetical protein
MVVNESRRREDDGLFVVDRRRWLLEARIVDFEKFFRVKGFQILNE